MARKSLRVWLDERDYSALKKMAFSEKKTVSESVRDWIRSDKDRIQNGVDQEDFSGLDEKIMKGVEEKLLIFSEVLIKNFVGNSAQKESASSGVPVEVLKFLVQKIAYMDKLLIEINAVTAPVSSSSGESKDSISRAKLANGSAESSLRLFGKE